MRILKQHQLHCGKRRKLRKVGHSRGFLFGKASGEHAIALRWFRDQTGRTVSWSDIRSYAEKGANRRLLPEYATQASTSENKE
jgi:hypothetical protein